MARSAPECRTTLETSDWAQRSSPSSISSGNGRGVPSVSKRSFSPSGVELASRARATGSAAPSSGAGCRAAMMRRVSARFSDAVVLASRTWVSMRWCTASISGWPARCWAATLIPPLSGSPPASLVPAGLDPASWDSTAVSSMWMLDSPWATVSWMSPASRIRSSASPALRELARASSRAATSASSARALAVASRCSSWNPTPRVHATAAPMLGPVTAPMFQPMWPTRIVTTPSVSAATTTAEIRGLNTYTAKKNIGKTTNAPSSCPTDITAHAPTSRANQVGAPTQRMTRRWLQ